jgi:aquaporin Z
VVLADDTPELGIGYLGVSLAFGSKVVIRAYEIGHILSYHLNSAVSIGLVAGGRFKVAELPHYIVAQVTGALVYRFVSED